MFAFVEQLLEVSLRTRGDFPFMHPSSMEAIMLDGIANCNNDGIATEKEFATAFAGLKLRFTASPCTEKNIELVPELARFEKCSAQVAAMAHGFAMLFLRRRLLLITWQELKIFS
ncbi:unnamed protein product [Peronospora farinosa]|uniref:EF-hand domain-containing protein n=1 Tax=Peronospora farinosa TaxID=134698 RepID=A0AAV0TVQ0_9STRA|nr:unnamed protein product [Peronospora farinosa]